MEEQLNDLTELHQNEILNLKQELASMEEKIAYQSYERARDIQVCVCQIVHKHTGNSDLTRMYLTKTKA